MAGGTGARAFWRLVIVRRRRGGTGPFGKRCFTLRSSCFRESGRFGLQPVAKANDLLERSGFRQTKKVIGERGWRCPTERADQCFVRNMIGNQAGADEGDPQTEDRRIDQQTGIAETLTFVARRVLPADMVEPAAPIRAAAVTLCRRIVKQRQT